MFKRLNRAKSGQIDLCEQDVLEGRCLRALALGREGDADLGEEALHSCRGSRAAEVLASHHLEVGELLLVLQPPHHRVVLALVLGGVATFTLYGLTFIECVFKPLNVFRV